MNVRANAFAGAWVNIANAKIMRTQILGKRIYEKVFEIV